MPDRWEAAAKLIVVFAVFGALVVGLYRLLRFIWVRLPQAVIATEWPDLGYLLGTILALIWVPKVPVYAWQTIRSLVEFFATLVTQVGGQVFAPVKSCSLGQPTCVDEVVEITSRTLGEAAFRLVKALNFPDFPIGDFLTFLLLALIFSHLIGAVLRAVAERRIGTWWANFDSFVPETTRSRIVFAALVLLSTYLALSAVLAVSSFQNRASQQYTPAELDKQLAGYAPRKESFDSEFPPSLPEMKVLPSLSIEGDAAAYAVRVFNNEQQRQIANYQLLQGRWTTLRDYATALPPWLREQAVYQFRSQSEGRIVGREAAEHYSNLVRWFQNASQNDRLALHNCWSQAISFASKANQTLGGLRNKLLDAAQRPAPNPKDYLDIVDAFRDDEIRLSGAFSSSLDTCAPLANPPQVPSRQPFGASLGIIGSWAGWVLQSESMPVVIVVGLVGFSLLGATVSRVVRESLDTPGVIVRLTLDDLLFVIAGGTTAAFVVFLAAYGGLAVLAGGSTSDPNPYVVFVTCLVGAAYSEVVWRWARTKFLAPAEGAAEPGASPRPAAAKDKTEGSAEKKNSQRDGS